MDGLLQQFLNPQVISDSTPMLWMGFLVTLLLSLLLVPCAILMGFVIACISTIRRKWVQTLLVAWVDFFRSFPPLVLLIMIYSGSAFAGLELGAWETALVGLTLSCSAYFGEVLRGGLKSLPAGQIEAARSTGLNHIQALFSVAFPQVVRNQLPELLSNVVEAVKVTSLASVVALPELLYQARSAQSLYFNASPIFVAAAIYLILLMPLVRLLSIIEERSRTRSVVRSAVTASPNSQRIDS